MRRFLLGVLKKFKFLRPENYVKFYYEYYTGKKLDLENPVEFNEKIQWLKVYYRPKILNQLVDKYHVRSFVEEKIGPSYLNDLLMIAKKPGQINFNDLPKQFVVKGVHGCNFNLIVKDKDKLNKTKARLLFRKWLSKNQYYRGGLEWAYKDVPPLLIVEKYLEEPNKEVVDDYKFYCFDGKPMMVQIDIDRGIDHKGLYYDMNWNKLPFTKGVKKLYSGEIAKPKKFEEMVQLSAKLSNGFPFARVDFYYVNNQIYFGEMTFYPGDGRQDFKPQQYNKFVGDFLTLPKVPNGQKYITNWSA